MVGTDNPLSVENTYIRVRDEGHRITMTYKNRTNKEFENENEVIINNFDEGVKILLGIGCKKRYYYEKLREIYHIGYTEICWDTNPGSYDIMEIESKTKKELDIIVNKLGLSDKEHNNFKDNDLYKENFGIEIPAVDLTFDNMKRLLFPLVTKNKEEFNKLVNLQKKLYDRLKNKI